MARKSKYTPELARQICKRMAAGEVLAQICRDPAMPCRETVSDWRDAHPEFEVQFQRAQQFQYEHWADEIIEIGEDGSNDWTEREIAGGRMVAAVDHEHVQRSKLRVENRRWLLGKLRPETYGESQRIDLKGRITLSEKEIDNQLAALVLKTLPKKGDAE